MPSTNREASMRGNLYFKAKREIILPPCYYNYFNEDFCVD